MLKISLFVGALLLTAPWAAADEVHLMNGRTMSGIVTEETLEAITLDVGIGYVKLQRAEILAIERSEPHQVEDIQMGWAEKRLEDEVRPAPPLYRTRSLWGRK